MKQLLEQRTKENALNEQIAKAENLYASCKECVTQINKHPSRIIYRCQINGINLPFEGQEALDVVKKDEQYNLKLIKSLETQRKLCIENQQRIENMIKSVPTFEQRMEKYNNIGKWKW